MRVLCSSMLQELEDTYTLAHSQDSRVSSCSQQILWDNFNQGDRKASFTHRIWHRCSMSHISKFLCLLLQVLDLLVRIDFLDFLQCPTFMATSSGWDDLPERNSSAGVTYRPCPSVSAKKRVDCHACPGATSVTPGRAAQAVVTIPQPLPAIASQQWCPMRASQSSVMLCTVVTRTISEQFSASALLSMDGGSSITANLVTPAAQAVELRYTDNN